MSLSNGNELSSSELIQQVALMNWLRRGDADSKQLLEKVTTARVASDIWSRISRSKDIEAAQAKTIMAISDFVKKNPSAPKAALVQFIGQQIQLFAEVVSTL